MRSLLPLSVALLFVDHSNSSQSFTHAILDGVGDRVSSCKQEMRNETHVLHEGDRVDSSRDQFGLAQTLTEHSEPIISRRNLSSGLLATPDLQLLDGNIIFPYRINFDESIRSDCLKNYSETRERLINGSSTTYNSRNQIWFEPVQETRMIFRTFIIQALSPITSVKSEKYPNTSYNVILIWLRTGYIIAFYQTIEDPPRWLPVLTLGSTECKCPFKVDASSYLGSQYNAIPNYSQDYAGTIVLERAAAELYALEKELVVAGELNDWKDLFELYQWRNWGRSTHELTMEIKSSTLQNFDVYRVPQNIVLKHTLPFRSTETTAKIYNGYCAIYHLLGTSEKATHGQYISNFDGIFTKHHSDSIYNHALLITDGDGVNRGTIFYDLFIDLIKLLDVPVRLSIRSDGKTKMTVGKFDSGDVSCFGNQDTLKLIPLTSSEAKLLGITQNPVVDILSVESAASIFNEAGSKYFQFGAAIAAEIGMTRMAYRAAVIMTSPVQEWIKVPHYSEQVEADMKNVKDTFIETNKNILPFSVVTGQRPITRHDIFRVFAEKSCLFK